MISYFYFFPNLFAIDAIIIVDLTIPHVFEIIKLTSKYERIALHVNAIRISMKTKEREREKKV